MTYEQFQNEVETMIINLQAIKISTVSASAWSHDYSIAVCECAAKILGCDSTFAKMFNRDFREKACEMMFQSAIKVV